MSLDGVVQAPGGAQEDPSGGFEHGGWHMGYFDEIAEKWVLDDILRVEGGYLLGRRTYEIFAAYWPHAGEEEAVIAEPLNSRPKYVASRSLSEPLAWQGSTLLKGEVADAVAALKQEDGGDLGVIGSSMLVQTLIEHNLVDELHLMIDPLVLGGGKSIYRQDGARRPLRLVESHVTTTGVILANYAPAEASPR
jgi:dihydrofolate reductase